MIIVNAAFLQSGSRPSPFLATPKPVPQLVMTNVGKPAEPVPVPVPAPVLPRPNITNVTPQPVAVRRNDPIAELIGPSPRIAAVQRALSDYGYGQIKATGMLDEMTASAIERFEREHRLPVSGRVSDRLIAELANMMGHPIE